MMTEERKKELRKKEIEAMVKVNEAKYGDAHRRLAAGAGSDEKQSKKEIKKNK